ncbi:serine/threonine protein phosphatase [Weeksellaceae bacterium TAE3-ERU29]|nr:serine/threonine protein phosphatase [Weeksellaceae bacterium TAE3-ERU29]
MNRYAISDIHGCFFSFREILNKINFSKNDELYLLGDYINKGPRSKEVIDFIIELQNQGYKITTLRGNHEQILLDSINKRNRIEGLRETLDSFKINNIRELGDKYINWFYNLKYFHETQDFIFVHAGFNFNKPNPLSSKRDMLWMREWYHAINYNWLKSKKIIHGHTPTTKNQIQKMLKNIHKIQVLAIDNGCVIQQQGYGSLCCLELNKLNLVFQENID